MIDEQPRDELARNLKDSGNEAFKLGRTRWDDAIGYYTLALEKRCDDGPLNAVILSNRAQVHLSMGNHGYAWADCQAAVEHDERNVKAYFRGARAAKELGKLTEAAAFCRRGLGFDAKNADLIALHAAVHAMRKAEADKAQRRAEEHWAIEQNRKRTLRAIADAGIRCGAPAFDSAVVQQGFKSNARWEEFPASSGASSAASPDGELVFAVLFLYPEFFQSDFVQNVASSHSLGEHLQAMFPPEQPPAPWDRREQYSVERLEAYFEVDGPTYVGKTAVCECWAWISIVVG